MKSRLRNGLRPGLILPSSLALPAGLALVLVLLAGSFVHPAQAEGRVLLQKIRHRVVEGRTRIVLDVSGRADYRVYAVTEPNRVAVNLPDVGVAKAFKRVLVEGGAVRAIRINRLSWGSQVVLDLRSKAAFSEFHLDPVDGMPYRLVIDVEPTHPAPATKSTAKARSRPARSRKSPTQAPARPMVIAIDAGHGGSDPGAIGKYKLVEKRAALDIARQLAREIDSREGFKAVLTRDRDVFLSLRRRTEIAQQKGADIFVSVHLNSAPRRSARGAEVYFLSPSGARSTANRFLANKVNAAKELGVVGNSSEDILHMLVDVNQQSMMQRSQALAEHIFKAINRRGLPPPRTIKQRAFAVLKSIAMPSVMVETGFLTNAKDASILKGAEGRARIATAIADGVVSFLGKYPPAHDDSGRVRVHHVSKGETLWKISRNYNTTVASIQRSNKLGTSQTIRVGQKLVIREGNATY